MSLSKEEIIQILDKVSREVFAKHVDDIETETCSILGKLCREMNDQAATAIHDGQQAVWMYPEKGELPAFGQHVWFLYREDVENYHRNSGNRVLIIRHGIYGQSLGEFWFAKEGYAWMPFIIPQPPTEP